MVWVGKDLQAPSSPAPYPTVLNFQQCLKCMYTHRDSKMYSYSQQKEIDPAIFQLKGKSMKDLLMKEIR